MDLNEYQEKALETAQYPKEKGIEYTTLGLVGEAGEVANKLKKSIRKGVEPDKAQLMDELGDCLWYASALAKELGYTLEEVAFFNLNKLSARKELGQIKDHA